MTLRLLLSLSLLPLAWQAACAQPADEFFHHGAQSYLSNNVAKAREEVDNGLKLFPDDIKLKKLDELLKQQQQQQQQQQSKNEEQKQEQDQKDQQKQQQQQDQQNQQQQSKPDQKEQQKKDPQAKSSGEKKDEQEQGEPPQSMQAHAMTPQEAKQLLDAQKGEERTFVFGPTNKTASSSRIFKDW